MEKLQICLCSVCNCKEWKLNLEKENNYLKTEIEKFKKCKDFDRCQICDDILNKTCADVKDVM